MFRKLLATWRVAPLVGSAFDDAMNMLRLGAKMYGAVIDAFFEGQEPGFDIKATDKQINELEIEARRKLLEHLSLDPKHDLVFSMVLTSVVNDLERVGDLTKNVYELKDMFGPYKPLPPHTDRLAEMAGKVREQYALLPAAFGKGERESAEKVMALNREVKKAAEQEIADLAEDAVLETKPAVTFVLLARYLKRSSSHLSRVASGVIDPYHLIGFQHKKPPVAQE
jgi:phosphate transport system protein